MDGVRNSLAATVDEGDDKASISEENTETGREQYQLTELKNVPRKSDVEGAPDLHLETSLEETDEGTAEENNIEPEDEDFQIRLAESVCQHPCLYDQLDPNFGQKQASVVYRMSVWERVAEELQYSGDLTSLQNQWKKLRSRLVRYLRKESHESQNIDNHPVFAHLRWLERYLMPINERGIQSTNSDSQPSTSPGEIYYVDQQSASATEEIRDVMISGYQTQSQSNTSLTLSPSTSAQPPHRLVQVQVTATTAPQTVTTSQQSDSRLAAGQQGGFYIIRNGSGVGGAIRFVNSNPSEQASTSSSPPSSKMTVVPATRNLNGAAILHLQPGQHNIRPNQRVHIITAPSSSQPVIQFEHRSNASDPITVTSSDTTGMVGNVKKGDQSGMMVVDPSHYYQTGGQKMYRIVNLGEVHDQHVSPPRKRMVLTRGVPSSVHQQQSTAQSASLPTTQQLMSLPPSSSRTSGAAVGQLAEEVIIDDGVQDRTIVIDNEVASAQPESDSPLLSESPTLGSMMISGHQVMTPRTHQVVNPRNIPTNHVAQLQPELTAHSPEEQPQYLQQCQYDADLAFQQLISAGLSRYDEDMKSIIKFNIQRILLDARFGKSFSNQIINEDNEIASGSIATNSVVSHDMVTQ